MRGRVRSPTVVLALPRSLPSRVRSMSESTPPVALSALDVPPRATKSHDPEPFASRMAGRAKRALGDAFGLANFGVHQNRLAHPPVWTPFNQAIDADGSAGIGFRIVGTPPGAFRHARHGAVDAHLKFKTLHAEAA